MKTALQTPNRGFFNAIVKIIPASPNESSQTPINKEINKVRLKSYSERE